jgi:hypothetical protein
MRVLSVSPRFQSPGEYRHGFCLQPTEVGFVCVAAISIAGAAAISIAETSSTLGNAGFVYVAAVSNRRGCHD